MKHYLACLLILLIGTSSPGQTKHPTLRPSPQIRPIDRDQEQPYEGRRISSLEFGGNHHFSLETLRRFLNTKEGDPFYAEKLEVDLDRVRVLLLSRDGYLKATFGKPEIDDTSSGLKIVVPMQEGIQYRWGVITVEDSTVFSRDEIAQIIGLESGVIADGFGLGQKLNELTKLYRDRGYLDFAAIPELDFKQLSSEAGVVDIALEVDEGEVFRINAIQFEGNTRTTDSALSRLLRIQVGDVYNESLLQKSLKRLNSLGLYEELRLEDVAFHKTDHNKLDLTIRLRE